MTAEVDRANPPNPYPLTVIPAQAGIQNPGMPPQRGMAGVDSRFRGNDEGEEGMTERCGNPRPGLITRRGAPGFWIPVCAGMTVGAGMMAGRAGVNSPQPHCLP